MRRVTALDIAFLMLLVALPLLSLGTMNDQPVMWWIGLAILLLGFIIPLALRFVALASSPEDEPDVGEEPS
ncbi:MAG: hypothetical protein GX597_27545 [Anaerolineaceae bacterium]|nr:hypothetical protein [Anaerolineaceae bacterium]